MVKIMDEVKELEDCLSALGSVMTRLCVMRDAYAWITIVQALEQLGKAKNCLVVAQKQLSRS